MLEVPKHGINRVDQVKTRINQRSVEIEDREIDASRIEWMVETGHESEYRTPSLVVCRLANDQRLVY
jgi:hypothetical protein